MSDEELEWAFGLVSSNLAPAGHRFNAQDKMDDLCDPSARFALVTERVATPAAALAGVSCSKGKGKKKTTVAATARPVAFAHFRFSVQGEAGGYGKRALGRR